MTGFEDENDLAACLREVLAPKFTDVYAKVNLASRKFYDDWEKFHPVDKTCPILYRLPPTHQVKADVEGEL